MMPSLKSLYQQYQSKGFEIIAISLDKDSDAYEQALAKGNYAWINYSELKGWACSIAAKFGIRATPTMILVDRANKIVAKPRDPEMLRIFLEQYL